MSPTGRPESREQSWTAVTLLFELDTFRQEERDALTVLGERLILLNHELDYNVL